MLDALGTPAQHILLFGLVSQHLPEVFLRGQALDGFPLVTVYLGHRNLPGCDHHAAALDTFAALDHYPLPRLEIEAGGIIVVDASSRTKTYAHYRHRCGLCHQLCHENTYRPSNSSARRIASATSFMDLRLFILAF